MKKTTNRRHPMLAGLVIPFLLTAGAYGCADFLSDAAAPQGTLNEQTLSNRAGVEGSLIAAYRALEWNNGVGGAWGNAASNWVWGSVTSDDAYKGSEEADQPAINDIEKYIWDTPGAEGYLNDRWRGLYEGIVRSNATLRLAASLSTGGGDLTPADARMIRGEALFLRAHFHFGAWRMWGNIPYYLEEDTDFRKANTTSAEVVTMILADLDSAIASLPTTPRRGQIGRATQWTAKAYKGRMLAYAGQWASARTVLNDVRNNGPYALEESYDRVWTGFQRFANGKETIFAYQASANDGEPSGNNANYGERLNFPHSGSPFGCCGFHQPSQNLVNFFAVDDDGLPTAFSNPSGWNARDAEVDAAATARAGGPIAVDPRLDWTVGRDGVPYKDWGMHQAGWIRAPAYGGPYSPKKNAHEKASNASSTVGWVPTQLNSVNIHLFRYADLLLMLAEAEVEAGNLSAARDIVNEIRERAGERAQGPGTDAASIAVPLDDPSITWATYRVGQYPSSAFSSQAVARDIVRMERRLELAMEGQRFFDLRRWGIAAATLNGYVNGIGGGVEKVRRLHLTGAQPFSAKHSLFPIPEIQIELSKVGDTPRLKQNDGW